MNAVPNTRKNVLSAFGLWTLVGLLAVIIWIISRVGVNFSSLLTPCSFNSGSFNWLPVCNPSTLIKTVTEVLTIVLVTLPVALVIGSIFKGKTKSYNLEALDKMLDKGPWMIFIVVAIEELFTRGLFLGLLTKLFPGPIAFAILFFVGNAIWSLIHLANFTDPEERKIQKVLPQFVGGIAFTYIFVRWGLGIAIMAHFLYDVILFSTMKEKVPTRLNFYSTVYYFVIGVIVLIVMKLSNISLNSLAPWLTNEIGPITNFSFWNYVLVLLAVDVIVALTANILLMDNTDFKSSDLVGTYTGGLFKVISTLGLGGALVIGMILLVNWLLSFVIHDVITRVVIITILQSFLNKTSSGSALTRVTTASFVSNYFTVVAVTVLGFWYALGIALVCIVFELIPTILDADH